MYIEDDSISGNCDKKFAMNCTNYEIKCKTCKVNGGKYLQYKGIKNIGKYPELVNIDKSKLGRVYNRKGKDIERKVIQEIGGNLTYMSGAKNGDGDGRIYIKGEEFLISHKYRFNNKNCLGPTTVEFKKDKTQGIEVWITSSKEYGNIVTMDKNTFLKMLAWIEES